MIWNKIIGVFSNDLAIDLGTANTLVYVRNRGIICNEPSVVVMKADSRKTVAAGIEAKRMLGKTPFNIITIRPLKDGVIADFDAAHEMLKYFINKAHNRKSFVSPRVIIGVPSSVTLVERRAVKETAEASGAREVYLIDEPVAAAVGVGLPIGEPYGNMIVDIGGGTTDVAIISMDGIVFSKAVRVGGDTMDEKIVEYVKEKYNFLIGDKTAEQIKIEVGSAFSIDEPERTIEVSGRDLITGIPKTVKIGEEEVRETISGPVALIISAIKTGLENTPPELASDIVDNGIVIAGGGALLRGLDSLIRHETKLPIIVPEDPLTAVVMGVGKMLEDLELLRRVTVT